MNETIIIEHNAVTIVYREAHNKWAFILNGRDYDEDSLSAAKQKIEKIIKELKLKQRKQFEPIPAFNYALKPGRITSLVGLKRSWRSNHEDIMNVRFILAGEGEGASVTEVTELYADTPKNRDIMAQVKALTTQAETLRESLRSLTNNDVPTLEE
jgi:hypothetical protein